MVRNILILVFTLISFHVLNAQVGINTDTPHPSAALEIKSDTSGLLIPRVADTSMINNPVAGLMAFQHMDNGFYVYDGGSWKLIGKVAPYIADADGDTKIQVEENPDEDVIRIDLGGNEKLLIEGDSIGRSRLSFTDNNQNIAIGQLVLRDNTIGTRNVGLGYQSLVSNKTGNGNVGLGYQSLAFNNGSDNVGLGSRTLRNNVTGGGHVAIGSNALSETDLGLYNVAVGYQSSSILASGNQNTALGGLSLSAMTGGENNVALGAFAGYTNTTGSGNVYLGTEAGANAQGSNKLFIENSGADSTGALIYGEFDNDFLRLNGRVVMRDGWSDADGDTKIQVEENPDEDMIRFDIRGIEAMNLRRSGDFVNLNFPSNTTSLSIGHQAMFMDQDGNHNQAIGYKALHNIQDGLDNQAVGINALFSNNAGSANQAFGKNALYSSNGFGNLGIGLNAGYSNVSGQLNTYIGNYAGENANGSGNIFLGYASGIDSEGNNKLFIENSGADSTGALIYGEFDKDSLRFNAAVNINGNYILPTSSGNLGQSIVSDGSKQLKWGTPSLNILQDVDEDTKIQVEENADEDIIRFDLGGAEKFRFTENSFGNPRLEFASNNNNILIGNNTGNPLFGGSNNLIVGNSAGSITGSGSENVFIGHGAGENTYSGSKNVFIGINAGKVHNGSNKLFIENTDADSIGALIYGEFDNDILRLNARVSMKNGFSDLDGDTKIQVEESADEDIIRFDLGGSEKMNLRRNASGISRLDFPNNNNNIALGENSLSSNTTGRHNISMGKNALFSNSSSDFNLALGAGSLQNTTGSHNIALGLDALNANVGGSSNVAIGQDALRGGANANGDRNVGIGYRASYSNTSGFKNIAIGDSSLYFNTTGDYNVAIGINSAPLIGINNSVSIGHVAAASNHSVAIGDKAQGGGTSAVAIGHLSKANISGAIAIGHRAETTQSNAISIGFGAMASRINSIAIGQEASAAGENSIIIGNLNSTTTNHVALLGNTSTIVTGGYTAWSNLSDGRFKTNVAEDVPGLDFINNLRPVTYNENLEKLHSFLGISPDESLKGGSRIKSAITKTGFIAQEVEAIADSIGYKFEGVIRPENDKSHYRLSYATFVVPLVKSVQEQQGIIDQQEKELVTLQEEVALLKKQVSEMKEVNAKIEKLEALLKDGLVKN